MDSACPRLNLLISYAAWQPEAWVDALPRLLEPMGVVSTRVATARQAERFIRTTPVHIAVVDLSLPLDEASPSHSESEEVGSRILEMLSRLDTTPPTVVVRQPRTQRDCTRDLSAALRCGAFAVVDRTATDLELMLRVMQRCLTRFYAGRWPGIAT